MLSYDGSVPVMSGLLGSELVPARMDNGVCRDSKTLDELWAPMNRPDAFSKYLVDQVNASLNLAGGQ